MKEPNKECPVCKGQGSVFIKAKALRDTGYYLPCEVCFPETVDPNEQRDNEEDR